MKCENVIQLNDKNKATVLKSIKNVKKHGILKKPSGKHVRVIYTLFSCFLLLNIDCGYSLETPQ